MQQTLAVKPPDVSYARSGDVAIAYQLVGRGPMDVVFLRGITGDLLSTWEQPLLVRHVEGLASCRRVIMLARRGTVLSDRVLEVQSLEATMDIDRPVTDPVGSARAFTVTGVPATSLAGHLHAGQIVLPYGFGKLLLAHPGARYPEGVFERNGTTMHVSPGLGTTFVPFRFFARPEATELVLRCS